MVDGQNIMGGIAADLQRWADQPVPAPLEESLEMDGFDESGVVIGEDEVATVTDDLDLITPDEPTLDLGEPMPDEAIPDLGDGPEEPTPEELPAYTEQEQAGLEDVPPELELPVIEEPDPEEIVIQPEAEEEPAPEIQPAEEDDEEPEIDEPPAELVKPPDDDELEPS